MPFLSPRTQKHAGPLAGLAVLCLLVLLPSLTQGEALGHPISDMPDHLWGSWFFGSELLAGRWPDHTSISHLPEGGTIWIVDPVGGVLALLLRPLGFPAAWNGALLTQLIAASWAGYALGFSELQARTAAFTCGLICGLCPFALGLIHSGLSEYLGMVWPTLFLLFLLRSYRGESSPYVAGLLLFGATLQAVYYGLFGVLFAGCLVLGPDVRQRTTQFIKMLITWTTLTVPLLLVIRRTITAEDALVNADTAPGWTSQTLPTIDVWSWVRPGDWVHPPTPELGNPGILHVNYIGLVVLLLLVLGFWRSQRLRPYRIGSLLFGVFCLGPRLSWGGKPLALLLPMAMLFLLPFSPFEAIHHPYRIAAFAMPLVALWAAAGLQALPRKLQRLAPPLILLDFLLLSPVPYPLAASPLPDTEIYGAIGEGAVLDFPPDLTTANRRYTMGQVQHTVPIAYGVNRFLSPTLKSDPLVNELLGCIDRPQRLARNRDIPPKERVRVQAKGPHRGGFTLHELGFHHIVVHEAFLHPPESRCVERLLEHYTLAVEKRPDHSLWRTR
ncbi:MAG: hypothetical protein VXW32_08050 [Myxococcota bacterium]|nr:hypothetical protein [Myxococcota bacterium]